MEVDLSRGLGVVQQKVVRLLGTFEHVDVEYIARLVYGEEAKKGQIQIVRQAVAALVKRKLIKQSGISEKGDPCWVLSKPLQRPQQIISR
jgi:hypothetical protein